MQDLKTKKVDYHFKDAKGKIMAYLEKYKKRINHYDYDFFIVVCGKERRGKSTLAIQIGEFMTEGNLKVENICMDAAEYTVALQKSKKGEVIIFDEAGTNLYSREAMTGINRMLTKSFMVSGLKNICIILCIPSFFSLDSYIRTHRVDLLFYVPSRGKFKAYSHKRAKLISLLGSKLKKMEVVRAIEVGWFKKGFTSKKLEKEYREKETKYKLGYIKDIKRDIGGYFTTAKFCQITGFTMLTIYRWINSGEIKAKKVGSKWFIPKEEADRIVKERIRDTTSEGEKSENNDIKDR